MFNATRDARAAHRNNYRGASAICTQPRPFWSASALPPLFRSRPRHPRSPARSVGTKCSPVFICDFAGGPSFLILEGWDGVTNIDPLACEAFFGAADEKPHPLLKGAKDGPRVSSSTGLIGVFERRSALDNASGGVTIGKAAAEPPHSKIVRVRLVLWTLRDTTRRGRRASRLLQHNGVSHLYENHPAGNYAETFSLIPPTSERLALFISSVIITASAICFIDFLVCRLCCCSAK